MVRLLILKIRYNKHFHGFYIQYISLHTRIKISKNGYVSIGKRLNSMRNVTIHSDGGKITIGDGCFLNENVSITSLASISIGNGCCIGNNVVIVDHDHSYGENRSLSFISSDVKIGNNVWIGANSTILRGAAIGDNSVIAAGSIVKGKIDKDTLFYQKREGVSNSI